MFCGVMVCLILFFVVFVCGVGFLFGDGLCGPGFCRVFGVMLVSVALISIGDSGGFMWC